MGGFLMGVVLLEGIRWTGEFVLLEGVGRTKGGWTCFPYSTSSPQFCVPFFTLKTVS